MKGDTSLARRSRRSYSHSQRSYSRYTKALSESENSEGEHWKSRLKKKKSSTEQDGLSQPWHNGRGVVCRVDVGLFWCKEVWGKGWKRGCLVSAGKMLQCWVHSSFKKDGDGDIKESTKDFVRRYKLESRDVKGAPECMRIYGFVHGITTPKLIKRLHDKIPKTVDEMMKVTTSFLQGEVAASNHERKKLFPPWRHQEGNQKQSFRKGIFQNQQRPKRKHDRFMFLTKTPKESYALEKGKFKASPPMTNPFEKHNHPNKIEFHGEVGHNTDEYSKERRNSWEGKTVGHPNGPTWERIARQKITQSFSPNPEIFFPPLGEDEGIEGPMIIEADLRGHCIHRMEIQLLVTTGDEEHFASAWMNFIVVRSPSLYNGIIGRPRVRKLQAVSSTTHEMLKIPIEGGIITLKSSMLVPLEYMTGVPRHITEHRLNVREGCSSVRQKKRGQAADRVQAIQEEVKKLVEAEIMKEVHYDDWLSNPVIVKKHYDFEGYNVDAVLSLPSLKCLKDMQKSNGELASLNRFLAKSAEISLPFFKTLKKCTKKSDFHWTAKADEAFKQMKQFIAKLPMLVAPMEKEELIVYLAVAKETASAVLMTKRETKQMPIYFVSRALRGPEINYTSIEKLVLALVHANFKVERPEEDTQDTLMTEEKDLLEPWILFTDKSSCIDGSRAGLIFKNPEGVEFTYTLRFSLEERIKARLDARIKNWIEELPYVLWAHRTMIKSSNRDTPFSLTYETEEVIPAEIGMPTLRTVEVDPVQNNKALEMNLGLLEERREEAAIREAKSKTKMEKYYKFKGRNTSFKREDFVYHNNDASRTKDTWKLSSK
nr:reverse transcriptase domain-containing protein [Tanacetum cinerariifolium]